MQTFPCVKLKKGREKSILQRHHWIYSGAIHSVSAEGPIVTVLSAEKEKVGTAFYNKGQSIACHILAFGAESIEEALEKRLRHAIALRTQWFDPQHTNAYRLINAEGDGIPGLIVDAYAKHLVLQISHPALELLKDFIVNQLIALVQPVAIYEKSTSFLRKKAKMEEVRACIYGTQSDAVEIVENDLRFAVDILQGQKTGFFLDQRDMRLFVRNHARGKRVFNGFAYTGGFSIAALAGGASWVDSVEISTRCREPLEKNLRLNNLANHRFIASDCFSYLPNADLDYDLLILDPPAFVKKKDDIAKAFRAYKELNRITLEKMRPGSLLITSSCSYHVDESLFQKILFHAALEAKRSVKILGRHRQAIDHPVSIFHPESNYLKSFILYTD